jgi:hypothetical protein
MMVLLDWFCTWPENFLGPPAGSETPPERLELDRTGEVVLGRVFCDLGVCGDRYKTAEYNQRVT